MKNPLSKRILRELKSEFAKYAIISIFLVAVIGFISGFLVASGSLRVAYDEGFENFETCISSGTQIDIYTWFNINELSKCFLVINDYFNKVEENRVYLSKDEFIDAAKIFACEKDKGKC